MANSKAIRTEAKFQSLIKRDLELAGADVFNICGGNSFQEAGYPDLLVSHRSLIHRSCWLELKMHGGATRMIQTVKVRELLARGSPAFILRLLNNGDVMFEDADKHRIWQLTGWRDLVEVWSNKAQRRERGHLLMEVINGAWKEWLKEWDDSKWDGHVDEEGDDGLIFP